MIQLRLAAEVRAAIGRAQASHALPSFDIPSFEMERPKVRGHGDWSCGIAMMTAKAAGLKPRDVADAIVTALGDLEHVAKIEVAGPGFINFTLSHGWLTNVVREVAAAGAQWGRTTADEPEKILIEFVSANPTGPMHLGHGRWAAIGDTLARMLAHTGHEVAREFYVNDHGRQIAKFGESIAVRYLEHSGRDGGEIPEGGYVGAYVSDLAAEIAASETESLLEADPAARAAALGEEGARRMLAHQRATLESFGVHFDQWFSERTLHDGDVASGVTLLSERGHTYEADGALWLRTTDFGDDKDRILVRSTDGQPAYGAVDVAYYLNKRARGYTRLIYLLGADHHGWVARTRAAIAALGHDPDDGFEVLLGQFVHLVRGDETISMSKRQGEGVSFDTLLAEVGADAARYHFLRVSMDQTVNFDLDVVVAQTQENPVYYVQYAHARICSILRLATERDIALSPVAEVPLDELQHASETELLHKIAELPEAIDVAARMRAPHRMTRFAEDLAALFHAFYRDCRVISDDVALTQARLHLADATRITLGNVLALLGVSAPERM